jgi:hypothetical protein
VDLQIEIRNAILEITEGKGLVIQNSGMYHANDECF